MTSFSPSSSTSLSSPSSSTSLANKRPRRLSEKELTTLLRFFALEREQDSLKTLGVSSSSALIAAIGNPSDELKAKLKTNGELKAKLDSPWRRELSEKILGSPTKDSPLSAENIPSMEVFFSVIAEIPAVKTRSEIFVKKHDLKLSELEGLFVSLMESLGLDDPFQVQQYFGFLAFWNEEHRYDVFKAEIVPDVESWFHQKNLSFTVQSDNAFVSKNGEIASHQPSFASALKDKALLFAEEWIAPLLAEENINRALIIFPPNYEDEEDKCVNPSLDRDHKFFQNLLGSTYGVYPKTRSVCSLEDLKKVFASLRFSALVPKFGKFLFIFGGHGEDSGIILKSNLEEQGEQEKISMEVLWKELSLIFSSSWDLSSHPFVENCWFFFDCCNAGDLARQFNRVAFDLESCKKAPYSTFCFGASSQDGTTPEGGFLHSFFKENAAFLNGLISRDVNESPSKHDSFLSELLQFCKHNKSLKPIYFTNGSDIPPLCFPAYSLDLPNSPRGVLKSTSSSASLTLSTNSRSSSISWPITFLKEFNDASKGNYSIGDNEESQQKDGIFVHKYYLRKDGLVIIEVTGQGSSKKQAKNAAAQNLVQHPEFKSCNPNNY